MLYSTDGSRILESHDTDHKKSRLIKKAQGAIIRFALTGDLTGDLSGDSNRAKRGFAGQIRRSYWRYSTSVGLSCT